MTRAEEVIGPARFAIMSLQGWCFKTIAKRAGRRRGPKLCEGLHGGHRPNARVVASRKRLGRVGKRIYYANVIVVCDACLLDFAKHKLGELPELPAASPPAAHA